MQTRIYKVYAVKQKPGEPLYVRLVDASSAAQAIRHVVASEFTATVASSRDVALAMSTGVKVEQAGEATPEAATKQDQQLEFMLG